MKRLVRVAALVACLAGLSGCANVDREDVGMVAGAVAGGYLGHAAGGGHTAATVAGAAGGAYIGRQLAK